jgi:hypothetical protein
MRIVKIMKGVVIEDIEVEYTPGGVEKQKESLEEWL